MTADRLEELAQKCNEALAPEAPDIASVLELQDIADLARCARGWAKVESLRLSRLDINHVTSTYLFNGADGHNDYANGPTALEAVEAAEVKP